MVAGYAAQQAVIGGRNVIVLVNAYACKGRYVYEETAVCGYIGHEVRVEGVYSLNEQDVVLAESDLGIGELAYASLLEVECGRLYGLACQQVLELGVEVGQVNGVE